MLTVYTCVTAGYDRLLAQPIVPGVSYLCFSDRPDMRHPPGWEIRPLLSPRKLDDPGLTNRYHKMLCYEFPGNPFSVYIDGNVRLRTDPVKLVARVAATSSVIAALSHPTRMTVADELETCIARGKLPPDQVGGARAMIAGMHDEGFRDDQGLTANNLLIRDSRSQPLRRAMEDWWQIVSTGTRRDQLSLQYALWREGIEPLRLETLMPAKAVMARSSHRSGRSTMAGTLRRWLKG